MKLHVDHRTVFETRDGMLYRQVAYFERVEEAQDYARLHAALARAEEIAKEASLMIEDELHERVGCRFTGAGNQDGGQDGVTCWACLVQDKLATIRVGTLTQAESEVSQ